MSGFYAGKGAVNYANPIELKTSSPLDVRLLFETRDGLFAYNKPSALYNGIIASYKYLSTGANPVKNEQNESYIWYECNPDLQGYGKWRPFRQLDSGALFVLCPKGVPTKPLEGDQYSIHVAPKLDGNGNQLQTAGENGLPVWTQYVWVIPDDTIDGDYKFRGVRQSDTNWASITGGKWENCGDVALNISTSAFASQGELAGKLDKGSNCTYNDFMEYVDAHAAVHTKLENRIGTLEDFKNGFNKGLAENGGNADQWQSDLNITVSFDGNTWGSGNDYNPEGTANNSGSSSSSGESEG